MFAGSATNEFPNPVEMKEWAGATSGRCVWRQQLRRDARSCLSYLKISQLPEARFKLLKAHGQICILLMVIISSDFCTYL